MIIGIGCDIVNMQRMEKTLNKFPQRFLSKYFTETEQIELKNKKGKELVALVSKKFAVKEAAAKALGTGFQNGIKMSEICVEHNDLGKPCLVLSGATLKFLMQFSQGNQINSQVSISDDYPWAQAFVVFEKI